MQTKYHIPVGATKHYTWFMDKDIILVQIIQLGSFKFNAILQSKLERVMQ